MSMNCHYNLIGKDDFVFVIVTYGLSTRSWIYYEKLLIAIRATIDSFGKIHELIPKR